MIPLNNQQAIQAVQEIDQAMADLESIRKAYFHSIQKLIFDFHKGMYNISAHIYGSVAMGLSLQTSDMDIGITGLPLYSREDIETEMENLVKYLKDDRSVISAEAIIKARVPVIKLKMKNMKIDITLGTNSWSSPVSRGLCSTEVALDIMARNKNCREVVLILKGLLISKGLNEPYTGGLSSYGLLLLTAAYIRHNPFMNSITKCLEGVMEFYGRVFDHKTVGISPMLTVWW
jgi:non-canonical poly(A) RNA polymerase PAPD5/7